MGRKHEGMGGNKVWRFLEGSGRQGRVERYCCNVICGATTTSKVKGLRLDAKLPITSYKRGDDVVSTLCFF